jgi:hypothetical protein
VDTVHRKGKKIILQEQETSEQNARDYCQVESLECLF